MHRATKGIVGRLRRKMEKITDISGHSEFLAGIAEVMSCYMTTSIRRPQRIPSSNMISTSSSIPISPSISDVRTSLPRNPPHNLAIKPYTDGEAVAIDLEARTRHNSTEISDGNQDIYDKVANDDDDPGCDESEYESGTDVTDEDAQDEDETKSPVRARPRLRLRRARTTTTKKMCSISESLKRV